MKKNQRTILIVMKLLNYSYDHDMNIVQVNICQKLLFLHQPQYDDRLFIELQVQYMKIPSSNLGRTCCVQIVSDTQNNFCTQHVLPMFCKKKSF